MITRGGGPPPERVGDRYRQDTQLSRSDDGGGRSGKRGDNPPSRHLWVGNLSHSISESDLTDCFLRLGELDTVAFQPGRSYAFVNFKNDDDAIAALKLLQGFPLDGNPLRIEFAKADKSSMPSRHDDYMQRQDEQRSTVRGSSFTERDSGLRTASPDTFYHEKSRTGERNLEPSEVLWIGFPALLKVDELILRKAFSPFGEIEKITVLQGRNFAFVKFRNVSSACRAKETLQGKLFGNPKVHICFSRSEANTSGRVSHSSHFKSKSHPGADESFRQDPNLESLSADPSRGSRFVSDMDPGDSDVYHFNRKDNLYIGDSNTSDNWKSVEERGPYRDVYERRGSPVRERGDVFNEFVHRFPQNDQIYEELWDLPEDSYPFQNAKRLRTASFPPPDNDLPDYPFSDIEQEKHVFSRRYTNIPQPDTSDKNFDTALQRHKMIPDSPLNLSHPHEGRSDHWKASYDNMPVGYASLPSNPADSKRFSPEPERPSLNLWKWEGTIAKGGTPVCQARCFPVGKAFDTNLPVVLDCTARTGLDMLAKHYYQAAATWVVFFVPASDADMGYYNEFMHYLGEKQRAAVAKLDDKTTLFLVPPCDFSEKVLKVPGKLSISGVILRLEQPASNAGLRYHPSERNDTNLLSANGDAQYLNPASTMVDVPSMASFSGLSKSKTDHFGNVASTVPLADFPGSAHAVGSMSDPYYDNRHDYTPQNWNSKPGSAYSPHPPQNVTSVDRNMSRTMGTISNLVGHDHLPVMSMRVQENSSGHYAGGMSSNSFIENNSSLLDAKPTFPSTSPMTGLQPQQLAELASSLLLQHRQSGSSITMSMREDSRQPIAMNQPDSQFRALKSFNLKNNHVGAETATSQFSQLQHLQEQLPLQPQMMSNMSNTTPPMLQREQQASVLSNSQLQGTSTQESIDADPQKRLQATLQLAATLLQQIQQGKGT